MASPMGQVLFSLVIPRPPPPSSAECLSDKNLPVTLPQPCVGNLSKARQTGSLPTSEGSSHNLERRGSVHQCGATGLNLMR